MGTFGDSFTREFGKNTGKFVSNIIFGDKHSTPYRRVESKKRSNSSNNTFQKQIRNVSNIQEVKAENLEKRNLYALDEAVLKNIDALNAVPIPSEHSQLLNLLNQLTVQINSSTWETGEEEAKIRNQYWKALYQKYVIAINELQLLFPEDPHLALYKKTCSRVTRRRFLKRYLPYILVLIPFLFIGIMTLSETNPNLLYAIFFSLLGILFLCFGIYLIVKLKHRKQDKLSRLTISNDSEQAASLEITRIDLNNQNRISNRLSEIWSKYSSHKNIPSLLYRPIFSCEGIENSILFVGINPLYNVQDDVLLTPSDDGKSLMYGNFMGKEDCPMYFKILEEFASELGLCYSHINLLYARENNCPALLSSNPDFIREQLELTYDTIIKLQPKAIIFFSDYCRNLIWGVDRWVDPATEKDGHYILRYTDIPIYFSDDISILDEKRKVDLLSKVKSIL